MLRIALILFFYFHAKTSFSQEEYALPDSVLVTAIRPFDINKEVWSTKNQVFQLSHLSEGLKNMGTAVIQAQSPGSLNTLLIKGMPARHIGVMWNDINLSSSLNGVMDINLIPIQNIDDISVFDFGTQATLGNQSMAGGIRLSNEWNNEKGGMLNISASSLQNFGLASHFKSSFGKTFSKLGASFHYNKNIYAYDLHNIEGNSTPTNFAQGNVTADFMTIVKKSVWRYGTWLSSNERNLPSSIVSNSIEQRQIDRSVRSYISYQFDKGSNTMILSTNHIIDYLRYQSPGIISIANTNTFQSKAFIKNKSNNASAYIQWRSDIATPNFFTEQKTRNALTFGIDKLWRIKSSKIQLSIVQDIVDTKWQPTGASVQWQFKGLSAKLAKTYLLPSLNDLYWPQGGNEDLMSEKAIQSELNYGYTARSWTIRSTLWSNWVKDWIQWSPAATGIWTPTNLQRVWSRGMTVSLDYLIKREKSSTIFNFTPTIIRSEITEHQYDKSLVGNQLIYMPLAKINVSAIHSFNRHKIGIYCFWLSKRFDTTDNSEYIDAYTTFDVKYSFNQNASTELQISVYNVSHQMYEMVRFFPMPGINASIHYKRSF